MNQTRIFGACVVFGFLTAALADDSAISWGGSPKMLSGHPTISMVSEKVVLNVVPEPQTHDADHTDVDCTFVFHNAGPACSVRIGFPDRASGAYFDNYVTGGDNPHPTFQTLVNFKSWVDGKPVPTKVVFQKNSGNGNYYGSWHTKVVQFGAGQTLTVRDTYRQPESGGQSASGYVNEVQYVLSTGASWKGPIGSATVIVHLPGAAAAAPIGSLTRQNPFGYTGWAKQSQGAIYYAGFVAPTVGNGTLTFHAENLKPTLASDIALFWR